MRVAAGFILVAIFIARMIYRATVTRDLRQKPEELYLGLAFSGVWVAIYLFAYL